MKKLNGLLHLYQASQTGIDALTEYDSECKTYRFITGLLELPYVPEKWVKICAYDADCFDESGAWHQNRYTVEGSPGILPFPDYLPADFLRGKKENDILTFRYGNMNVTLTLKQLVCDPYYQPCDNKQPRTKVRQHRSFPLQSRTEVRQDRGSPLHKTDTAVSFLQPLQRNLTKSTGHAIPSIVPIILSASWVTGIAGIVAAGVVTAGILSMRAKK